MFNSREMTKKDKKGKAAIFGAVAFAIAAFTCVAVAGVNSVMAYFVSTDSVSNVFTVGSVKIKVLEPTWTANNPDSIHNMLPEDEAQKDPQIQNTGNSDAVAYMTVKMPVYHGEKLFNWKVGEGDYDTVSDEWSLIKTEYFDAADKEVPSIDNAASVKFIYGHKAVIHGNETTAALFDTVKVHNIKGVTADEWNVEILVDGYAIQANNIAPVGESGFRAMTDDELSSIWATLLDELGAAPVEDAP